MSSDDVIKLGETEWHLGVDERRLDLLVGGAHGRTAEERHKRVGVGVAVGDGPAVGVRQVQADARAAAHVCAQGEHTACIDRG